MVLTDPGPPLVSCILPTRNRRRFVGQAIAYFLHQDHPARELIVVDDGDDRIADLVPEDSRIRYLGLPTGHSVGAKRNIACEVSHGDLIAHWDDDDWQAPDRLSRQVAALRATGADVCGPAALLHYAPFRAEAWLYRPRPSDPPWVAGCSLLYRTIRVVIEPVRRPVDRRGFGVPVGHRSRRRSPPCRTWICASRSSTAAIRPPRPSPILAGRVGRWMMSPACWARIGTSTCVSATAGYPRLRTTDAPRR